MTICAQLPLYLFVGRLEPNPEEEEGVGEGDDDLSEMSLFLLPDRLPVLSLFMIIILLLPPGFACLSPVQMSLFMRVLLSNIIQSNRVLTMPFCFFLLFYFSDLSLSVSPI